MFIDWEKCLTHRTTAVSGDEPPDFGDPAEGEDEHDRELSPTSTMHSRQGCLERVALTVIGAPPERI